MAIPDQVTSLATAVGSSLSKESPNGNSYAYMVKDGVEKAVKLGTAAEKGTGTGSGEVPLNSDLGSASLVDAIGSGDLYGRDSILGTVSETAGVPTGAVIESGSNSDGEYTKYADGRVIATALVTVNFNGDVDLDSRRAFDSPVTFLYDFTAVDGGVGSSANVTSLDSSGRDFANGLIQSFELAGNDSGDWVLATLDQDTADAGAQSVSLAAIGRWFN
jgi:hypothetical protein